MTDVDSIVVNCSNAYTRSNRSWFLGRILRDREAKHRVDCKEVSLRIDIFEATGEDHRPDIDPKWLFSWVVIVIQLALGAVPWIVYGDWAIFMVTCAGTVGALVTGMLPQWTDEKWASKIGLEKIVALTKGNGHHHVMIFINRGCGWDVEALATAAGETRPETRWICGLLAICWILLLICVSGLKAHTECYKMYIWQGPLVLPAPSTSITYLIPNEQRLKHFALASHTTSLWTNSATLVVD